MAFPRMVGWRFVQPDFPAARNRKRFYASRPVFATTIWHPHHKKSLIVTFS
jgi:hypothetical protein